MYADATTAERVKDDVSEEFGVKVGVHQGSVLSPLLFTIVLDSLSKEFREGLPCEFLYADDLVLLSALKTLLMGKIEKWKKRLEDKGLKVNVSKTKIMRCQIKTGQVEESGNTHLWCARRE